MHPLYFFFFSLFYKNTYDTFPPFSRKIIKGENLAEEEISEFSFSFAGKYTFRLHFSFKGRLEYKKIITVRQVGYYFFCFLLAYYYQFMWKI